MTWAWCSTSPTGSRCWCMAPSSPATCRNTYVKTPKSRAHIWAPQRMLELDNVHAYYGKSHILQGISFRVGEGEIVSLLGRNGAGRSTTVKTIMGEVAPVGSIRFKGHRIDGLKPHRIARLGLGYVPEDREIFPSLT